MLNEALEKRDHDMNRGAVGNETLPKLTICQSTEPNASVTINSPQVLGVQFLTGPEVNIARSHIWKDFNSLSTCQTATCD
jgi:hypothetical protein